MSVFKGAAVAICTPFLANGEVDYDKFREQIEYQIENGTDAIVVCDDATDNLLCSLSNLEGGMLEITR